jgi:hypothetical protein
MNYTILIYESAADFAARTDPEKQQAYRAGWPPYKKALTDAGVFGGVVRPPLWTWRPRSGRPTILGVPHGAFFSRCGAITIG